MKLSSGKPVFAAIFLTALLPLHLNADEPRWTTGERYSIIKLNDSLLRLDQKTGNISICKPEGGKLACKLGFDERHTYQQEIDRINKRLDKVLVRLNALESGGKGSAAGMPGKTASEEEEFDRALKFADKAFRHFFGMVQELKKENKKDAI